MKSGTVKWMPGNHSDRAGGVRYLPTTFSSACVKGVQGIPLPGFGMSPKFSPFVLTTPLPRAGGVGVGLELPGC